MTYQKAVQYLYSLIDYEKSPMRYTDLKLERMRELVERIGNPQHAFPVILIAGTKGKGSTAYFLMRLLSAWGMKCGFHSKPHLFTFRERIRIGETCITPQDVAFLVDYLIPIVKEMERNSPFGRPTYFEVTVALAFLYFSWHKVDVAVVEVGLGGRLDATNVCDPQLTIITPISFDHMEILGGTLSAIAREKAGILRPHTKLILAPQEEEAYRTICEEARRKNVPVRFLKEWCSWNISTRNRSGSQFSWKINEWGEGEHALPILGDHQVQNFMTALLALKEWGFSFHEEKLTRALQGMHWPGRIELLSSHPLVIFDVAHNHASFLQLVRTLEDYLGCTKVLFLLGFLQGKEYEKIAQCITPLTERVILTQPLNPKAVTPWEIAHHFEEQGLPVEVIEDPFEAREIALHFAHHTQLPLVIAGSFYLAPPFSQEFSFLCEKEVELC